MSLEKVREEVLEQARNSADAIMKAARAEAGALENQNKARMEQEKKAALEEISRLAEEIERQELSQAKLDAKNSLLKAKKELIEESFAKARQKLLKLGQEEKKNILATMLKRAQSQIKAAHAYCSKDDVQLVKKLGNFSVNAASISGGLIAENEQKTIRLDLSYESILERVKEEHLTVIHKILFEEPMQQAERKSPKKIKKRGKR